MTEFELLLLLKYLVRIGLVGYKNDKSKVLVISEGKLLYTK